MTPCEERRDARGQVECARREGSVQVAPYSPDMARRARVEDVHRLARDMPHVTRWGEGTQENAIYQVGGKSFVFFRNPRPDAFDPVTGERYPDVIVFWVASESDKQALIQDQ